ncbi:FAD-binding protein [Magnetofaba australis]|uniref:Putative L-aspartate oxidase n=1 Tax=Magnetofaba australis IT-1 TaxID=1434232 RepID=A0A1Y2K9X4_9PROT|nr:FAD-binding protein [Magnetofaba australis]OSM08464.1 putative L-aspartate oxidase [Magnetofaba australis IT-1]
MPESHLSIFPRALRESARLVDQTRNDRAARIHRGDEIPTLSLSDRRAWLEDWHPDYRDDGKEALQVGRSQGMMAPKELVRLLQAWPRESVRKLYARGNLEPDYSCDVLVIGAGGAGAAAAIAAAEKGAKVMIATKLRHSDSNTVMAEGGIQAASQECDSPLQHYLDILGGGHFSNDPDLVEALTSDGPLALAWLEELGMMLDKYPTGRLKTRHGGGTSRKRLHSAGDITGLELMRVVWDRVRVEKNVQLLEFCPAVELLVDEDGRAMGAVVERLIHKDVKVIQANSVVIATGGFGRLHIQDFPTSNHYGATADGLVMAYRAGLPIRDLAHNQYHPTGIAWPEQKKGLLITEKFRGMGAQLLNRHGDAFVNPLEPRDVTSAAIIRECLEFGNGVELPAGGFGVWLDTPLIERIHGIGAVKKNFPGKYKEFLHHGIDISVTPLLAYPTLHYQNGGVNITPQGGVNMPGLYACGEVTGGVHGNNRLMGNALLEIIVFGLRAGVAAAEFSQRMGPGAALKLDHLEPFLIELAQAKIPETQVAPMLLPRYGTTLPI